MRVAQVPYGQKASSVLRPHTLQDKLQWHIGAPDTGKTLADMTSDDHVFHYPAMDMVLPVSGKLKFKLSLSMAEPRAYRPWHYRFVQLFGGRYFRLLTHDENVLGSAKNATFVPYGNTLLADVKPSVPQKTRGVSIIASSKTDLPGHRMRHRIIKWAKQQNDIDGGFFAMGKGYQWLDDKAVGHLPYRFGVVIENSTSKGYFTEKLIDCILCGSIPIYWGAPDISDFFDADGMIVCQNEAQIQQAIKAATERTYEKHAIAAHRNIAVALSLSDYEQRCAQTLLDAANA